MGFLWAELGTRVANLLLQQGISSLALQAVRSRAMLSIVRPPALVSVASPRLLLPEQQQQQQPFHSVTTTLRKRVIRLGVVRVTASADSIGLVNAGPWHTFAGLRAQRFNRRKDFVKSERSKRNYRIVASAQARDGRVR